VEPLVIADQGHFFTGLRTVTGPAGTSVYGTHVEYQAPAAARDNLVLVHGGGAAVDEIRLGDLGIHGNGHAMMLEKNNAEVAAVITDWIDKHT
jgi:hypothetical protein